MNIQCHQILCAFHLVIDLTWACIFHLMAYWKEGCFSAHYSLEMCLWVWITFIDVSILFWLVLFTRAVWQPQTKYNKRDFRQIQGMIPLKIKDPETFVLYGDGKLEPTPPWYFIKRSTISELRKYISGRRQGMCQCQFWIIPTWEFLCVWKKYKNIFFSLHGIR